ncbi:hypothetical protein HMPREF9554_01358 [Treponema phagedenis F0421]|nr:hypothetical protein HMPREF9554_01358 [Treponema phagedenis F0421]
MHGKGIIGQTCSRKNKAFDGLNVFIFIDGIITRYQQAACRI